MRKVFCMSEWLENISDKEFLQDNLTFASLYIAVYENMVDYTVTNIKSFLCDEYVENGKLIYKKTKKYETEILKRIVDKKGNKDITKASFLWLVDNGAITHDEYKKFIAIKAVRNKFAHELTSVICEGVNENEISLFFEMHSIYKKIAQWFFTEIEATILGYEISEDVDISLIENGANFAFDIALNVLYNGKSDEYKSILSSINKGTNL